MEDIQEMNKYHEALDYLRWIGSDGYYKKKREKSFDILQELIDKETPMKARADSVGCYCGNCAYRLGDNNGWTQATVKYCRNCGQALDWSEEE